MNWKSPTPEASKYVGYVAVTGKTYHMTFNMTAVHTEGMEHIDGKDWELFATSEHDKDFIWGMFVEGLGAVNVMVPVEQVRHLTEAERKTFTNRKMTMYGSHSGKPSYDFSLGQVHEPVAE